MPGAYNDDPSKLEVVVPRTLVPVKRAIFEKYKKMPCDNTLSTTVDEDPINVFNTGESTPVKVGEAIGHFIGLVLP
jgi:hypothetical protein